MELLPGPALGKVAKLGKATKVGRAVFRGAAKSAAFVGRAVAGVATWVGKGLRTIGGKIRRGLWLTAKGAEGGGKRAYYFLDEAENVWRAVPEEEAAAFVRCTNPCRLTEFGKAESRYTTEEIQQHILEQTGTTQASVGARALEETGVSSKFLQAVRAKHHVFVQQLRTWFKSKGINIDKYTIKLVADEHRLIHNEYRWNDIWKDFMKANPGASKRQVFAQMRAMLREYGLEGLPMVPYK